MGGLSRHSTPRSGTASLLGGVGRCTTDTFSCHTHTMDTRQHSALKKLLERRFDEMDLLVLYIDGMRFGEQCVLAAVGVDSQGLKHVLALKEGASENSEAVKDLL